MTEQQISTMRYAGWAHMLKAKQCFKGADQALKLLRKKPTPPKKAGGK